MLARPQSSGGKDDAPEDEGGEGEKERTEPQIKWPHILSSLESGRSSISAQERQRLARIYREFVEGRDGNMPSGQGGSEVGGRTSLM